MNKEQYDEVMNMPGPEYVSPVVAYLCSEEGKIFNGKVIGVQGGRVAVYSKPYEIAGLYRNIKKEGPWTVDESGQAGADPGSCALEHNGLSQPFGVWFSIRRAVTPGSEKIGTGWPMECRVSLLN